MESLFNCFEYEWSLIWFHVIGRMFSRNLQRPATELWIVVYFKVFVFVFIIATLSFNFASFTVTGCHRVSAKVRFCVKWQKVVATNNSFLHFLFFQAKANISIKYGRWLQTRLLVIFYDFKFSFMSVPIPWLYAIL